MRQILVDGYNVIRADPTMQRAERASLENARRLLLTTLDTSPRLRRDSIVVVFDGIREGRANQNSFRQGRVLVVFSARGQSADDVIKARVHATTDPEQVVVVTNDVDIRLYCERHGCAVSGSENLLNQLPGPRRLMRLPSQPRDEDEPDNTPHTLTTVKKGNPRRAPRHSRRPRDYRF